MSKARAFLDLCMGRSPEPAELDAFLRAREPEGQFHDFKDGTFIVNKKEPGLELRQMVSSLANADGGVLLLGVEDKTFRVTGCQSKGSQPLTSWATNALAGLQGWLVPPPRIWEVAHPDGVVLVIATLRTPRLVPVIAEGTERFYLRLGDSTREAPPYLVADLTLGRRQHPVLEVVSVEGHINQVLPAPQGFRSRLASVAWEVRVVNQSAQWVPRASLGLVSAMSVAGRTLIGVQSMVDVGLCCREAAHHFNQRTQELAPFVETLLNIEERIFVSEAEFTFGLYVLADGSPPDWYQASASLHEKNIEPGRRIRAAFERVPLGERAKVGTDAAEARHPR